MLTNYILMLAPALLMFGGVWFALHPWMEQKANFDERTRAAKEGLEGEGALRKAA
ncbi:MAG TPA: hypothetical protein VLW45_02810 [Pelomicrobium sp.]|nr:hypothetical protein [Pelomicrobium sp.]